MKEDKKYYDLLNEEETQGLGYYLKTFLIYLAIGCAILGVSWFFSSCDKEEPAQQEKQLYWKTRHDSIPETMKGEWVSLSDKTEFILNVTDQKVMTKDFTIDREQDNTVKVNDSVLHMYQGDKFYALVLGKNYMAITADNDCYGYVVRFESQTPIEEPNTNLN